MSRLAAILVLFALAAPAWALETDQFTVPDRPLADLGPTVDTKLLGELQRVVADANAGRAKALADAKGTKSRKWQRIYRQRALDAVAPQAIADAFFGAVADVAVPRCKIERWLEDRQSSRYAQLQVTPIGDSIYGANPFRRPPLLLDFSPTVNLYGQYVGVDKVGHFLQQGHEYFDVYWGAIEQGASNQAAARAAVGHGVAQERGFYGELTIGVYSNADLAANYAGLLLYRNLFETLTVGGRKIEPLLVWEGPRIVVTQRARDGVIKPFVTEHWSEAYNPSRYTTPWRRYVRTRVAKRTEAWLAFHQTTIAAERDRLEHITTYYGDDYGHSGLDDLVTIVNAGPTRQDPITASMHE